MSLGRLLAALAVLLLLVALGAGLWARSLLEPVSGSEEAVAFEVPPGASLGQVARSLEDAGIVKSALAFELLARWRERAADLRAGEYALAPSLGAEAVLERLAA